MLFEIFPSLPFAALVASFLWVAVIGLVAHSLVFRTRLFDTLLKVPMVPPFIALPAIMFAFLLAFMASDAWNNIGQARASLVNEVAAINRIAAVPLKPQAEDQQARTTLRGYVDAVIDEEFGEHFNQRESKRASEAIERLEKIVWEANSRCSQSAAAEGCFDGLTRNTLMKAIDDLRAARHQRLGLGFQATLALKWALVLSLALFTAISIAAVHRSGERTAALAQVLFCLAAWASFSMVSSHIQPYRGPDALTAAPLQALRGIL